MNEVLEKLVQNCLQKWSEGTDLDERLVSFSENFEEWISQIPSECQPLVLTLVDNLEYYSHKTTNRWLSELHRQLLEKSDISNENTIFAFIRSKYGKTNSSNDYWTEYKFINSINKNICIADLDSLEEEDWEHIDNIVFIDDFSGSGKSFIDELKKAPKRYENKNVYFITINIMNTAIDQIERYAQEAHVNIITISAFKQEKAFKRGLFEDDEAAKKCIEGMSAKFKIPSHEAMGFKNTQALVAFYNNTPNNTIGFIRYDTDEYKSIFPRKDDDQPVWMKMKKQRMARKQTNYSNATKRGLKDE